MSERSLSSRVAAGLVTTGVILGASGCADNSYHPSRVAETRLARIITPEMRRVAQAAIKLVRISNEQVNARQIGHDITEIAGTTTANALNNKGLSVIDVAMRNYPGTQIPNPAKVLVAHVEETDNATSKGPFVTIAQELVAPGQTSTTRNMEFTLTSIYGFDAHGWTAIESIIVGSNGTANEDASATFNTADRSEFAADNNGNPTNAFTTAKTVVSDLPATLAVIVDNFTPLPK